MRKLIPDHLAWIADALGVPAPVVASAEHSGDLLSLCAACVVRELRERPHESPAAADLSWLPHLLRAIRDVFGDDELCSRMVCEAGDVPYSAPNERLAAVLSTIGGGRCPSPAALGKVLQSVVGIAADGLRLVETSRRRNMAWYVVQPMEEE